MQIVNFGGNVKFTPKHIYYPKTEKEVLDILNRHKNGKIRVAASGHAWSDAIVSKDVILDMRYLNRVEIEKTKEGVWAKVEAGCKLQSMLDQIHKQTEYTVPTLGGIKKQTISGAISTGTHGTGKSSLSNYMEEIRLAAYDNENNAKIYTYANGAELKAARCAVGCMGVILYVKFRLVPKYWIRENIIHYNSLKDVLESEKRFPLQQFSLFPFGWDYFVYQWEVIHDKKTGTPNLKSYIHRIIDFAVVDYFAHVILKTIIFFASSKRGSSNIIRLFYAKIMPRFMGHKRNVADESERMLTLAHYLFRHLEMELFIPKNNLKETVETIKILTDWFGGNLNKLDESFKKKLTKISFLKEIEKRKGFYTHHYPLFFRRILPDETLISATGGAKEPYYSVSFFTYLAPEDRSFFYEYCSFMAQILTKLYGVKIHWGKYFPLEYKDIAHLYPDLNQFKDLCRKNDPSGVFQNEFTKIALGFK